MKSTEHKRSILESIQAFFAGMKGSRTKSPSIISSKTSSATDGTSLTDWKDSSPKPVPGFHNQLSELSSTESGLTSIVRCQKCRHSYRFTIRWPASSPLIVKSTYCPKCGSAQEYTYHTTTL